MGDLTKPMQKQKPPQRTGLPKPKVWEIVSVAKEFYTKNMRQNNKQNKILFIINAYVGQTISTSIAYMIDVRKFEVHLPT